MALSPVLSTQHWRLGVKILYFRGHLRGFYFARGPALGPRGPVRRSPAQECPMIHGERTTGHGEPGDLQSFGLDRVRALARLGLGARDRVELLQRARDKTANRVLLPAHAGHWRPPTYATTRCSRHGRGGWFQERRFSAPRSQENCASRIAMALAVVSRGAARSGTAARGVGIRARRTRWLRP